jgi:hypothetical protein
MENVEYDVHWDNEVVADNDEAIAQIEADITELKAGLSKLTDDENLL